MKQFTISENLRERAIDGIIEEYENWENDEQILEALKREYATFILKRDMLDGNKQ